MKELRTLAEESFYLITPGDRTRCSQHRQKSTVHLGCLKMFHPWCLAMPDAPYARAAPRPTIIRSIAGLRAIHTLDAAADKACCRQHSTTGAISPRQRKI